MAEDTWERLGNLENIIKEEKSIESKSRCIGLCYKRGIIYGV